MRVTVIAVTLFCLTLNVVGLAAGEESKGQFQADKEYQIVFSTFEKNSAGKYSYLRDSIQAMLASRLAARERVNVLEKTFSGDELSSLKKKGEQKGLSIGGKKADYLITGELFALTSGLEIQVELYPLVPDKKVLQFTVLSQTPDSLIAKVDELSQDIAQTALGEKITRVERKAKQGDVEGTKGFVTANPEAAYKRSLHAGVTPGVAGSSVTAIGRGVQIKTTVPFDMKAMDVGDIDGDGEREILVLAGQNLRLFKIKDKAIVQVAETSLPSMLTAHALNLADLDGDGKDEIYISGTDGLYVSSMIMKYDTTGGFHVVSRNIPWYLRPIMVPKKGWQLAGQQRGLGRTDLVKPGVYLLSLDDKNEIIQGKRLALPDSLNLFDFVYADLDGDGFYEIVAVDQKEKLRVYNPANELKWVSRKNYATSKIYLGPSRGGAMSKTNTRNFTPEEDQERDLIFVPDRIVVTDIDKDGKEEIVTTEGDKAGLSILTDCGSIAVVPLSAWLGTVQLWLNRGGRVILQGYVAGYGFTLLDGKQRSDIQIMI